MREAAIETQRSAPRRRPSKAAAPRPPSALPLRLAMAALGHMRHHPGRILGVTGGVLLSGAIVGNAVLFQSGRHPAPLFGRAPAQVETGASVPLPAARPVAATPTVRRIDMSERKTIPPEVISPAPKVDPMPAPAARPSPPKRADAIGALLRGADKTPVGTADPDPRIVSAQRSLAKLGFAVKPDGRLGAATRQALEKFGQDHHVTVGTDLSPKLLRELAAAASKSPG